MEKHLCVFSSDYRTLYLGDIYKVLSMPAGYIVHFRYKTKYVEDSILQSLNKLEGKYVYIFYTHINNEALTTKNYSVRKALITKVDQSQQTDLIHVYMSLDDFVNTAIKQPTDPFLLPTHKYFVHLELDTISVINWHQKISELKEYFHDFAFFYVSSIKKINGKILKIKSRSDKKRSYYKVVQGRDYLLDMQLANPNEAKSSIKLFPSTNDISFNTSNPLPITAHFDDIIVPIHFKSINVSVENSFISIGPVIEVASKIELAQNCHSNIEVEKRIGSAAVWFGIFSFIAAISFWSLQSHVSAIYNIHFDKRVDWIFIISGIMLCVSTAYLFHKYNKK